MRSVRMDQDRGMDDDYTSDDAVTDISIAITEAGEEVTSNLSISERDASWFDTEDDDEVSSGASESSKPHRDKVLPDAPAGVLNQQGSRPTRTMFPSTLKIAQAMPKDDEKEQSVEPGVSENDDVVARMDSDEAAPNDHSQCKGQNSNQEMSEKRRTTAIDRFVTSAKDVEHKAESALRKSAALVQER